MPQSLATVHLHIIFSTKERRRFLQNDEIRSRLHAYIGGICRSLDCPASHVGGATDHVHILSQLSRTMAIADLLRDVKKQSSVWMHEQGMPEFAWQLGYAAYSVSHSQTPKVRAYIADQMNHHEHTDFKDELRAFAAAHDQPLDERYAWD